MPSSGTEEASARGIGAGLTLPVSKDFVRGGISKPLKSTQYYWRIIYWELVAKNRVSKDMQGKEHACEHAEEGNGRG